MAIASCARGTKRSFTLAKTNPRSGVTKISWFHPADMEYKVRQTGDIPWSRGSSPYPWEDSSSISFLLRFRVWAFRDVRRDSLTLESVGVERVVLSATMDPMGQIRVRGIISGVDSSFWIYAVCLNIRSDIGCRCAVFHIHHVLNLVLTRHVCQVTWNKPCRIRWTVLVSFDWIKFVEIGTVQLKNRYIVVLGLKYLSTMFTPLKHKHMRMPNCPLFNLHRVFQQPWCCFLSFIGWATRMETMCVCMECNVV